MCVSAHAHAHTYTHTERENKKIVQKAVGDFAFFYMFCAKNIILS